MIALAAIMLQKAAQKFLLLRAVAQAGHKQTPPEIKRFLLIRVPMTGGAAAPSESGRTKEVQKEALSCSSPPLYFCARWCQTLAVPAGCVASRPAMLVPILGGPDQDRS
jgi:hypothetical protein